MPYLRFNRMATLPLMDGDGEVGGLINIEVAGGDGEAAWMIDRVMDAVGIGETALAS